MICSVCKKREVDLLLYRAGLRKCYTCELADCIKMFNKPHPLWVGLQKNKKKATK